MRKFVALFFAFLILITSTNAAMVVPLPVAPASKAKTLTSEQFSNLSVKEFQNLTGKKLNFAQKFVFKAAQKVSKKAAAAEGKSQVTALLLCLFLGGLGIHRFYLGYTWQGVVQ
ncbi:MAG TPA: NINE protein, partial [Chitinophagaceae bacterium]|nr:NINE protein [Chitinophagaceae bacterium]